MSATAASRRRRSFAAVLRRYGWSYIFVLPTFSLFVVFTLLPVVQGLVLSLQNARVTGGEFIGLANFETLAADPVFIQAVGNTILYATVVVAAQITLALVVASLIQPLGPRAHVFYRALFYLPLVNSAILVAMVWRWIFNANPYGLANAALSPFGLGPYLWIGSSDQALIAVREQSDADKKTAAHAFAKYLTGPDIGPDLKKQTPPVEYWLAPAGRKSAAGIYGDYHPAKAKVATMGAFTYVLPNVSTWSEIDQKYLRPARDAALEGKKTPKQALDEVAPQAQKLLDEANK